MALRRSEHVLIRAGAAAPTTMLGVIVFGAVGVQTASAIMFSWVLAASLASGLGLAQLARASGRYHFRPRLRRGLVKRLLSVGVPNYAITVTDNEPGLAKGVSKKRVLGPDQLIERVIVHVARTAWPIGLGAVRSPLSS